jgi:glutathione synthase/RimK-type ligase-like ATP-grasp enzyme
MQAEEQAFLEDPWRVFGLAQRAALQSIRDAMGLDYFGIDCALDRDGAVVVFEANASMLVHGNNRQFPYKKGAVERIRQAFHTLLERRALEAQ